MQFIEAVKQISWWDVYSCDSVEIAVNKFTLKINKILDAMAPVKSIQVRNKYAPWISENTKEKIKERDEAQKVASISDNPDAVSYTHLTLPTKA